LVIRHNSLEGGKEEAWKTAFYFEWTYKALRNTAISQEIAKPQHLYRQSSTSLSEAMHVLSKLDADIHHAYQWLQFYFYSWILLNSTAGNEGSAFSQQRDKEKQKEFLSYRWLLHILFFFLCFRVRSSGNF